MQADGEYVPEDYPKAAKAAIWSCSNLFSSSMSLFRSRDQIFPAKLFDTWGSFMGFSFLCYLEQTDLHHWASVSEEKTLMPLRSHKKSSCFPSHSSITSQVPISVQSFLQEELSGHSPEKFKDI